MKKGSILPLAIIGIMSVLLISCGRNDTPYTRTIFAMDTVMDFTVYGDEAALDDIERLVRDIEGSLSVTDDESLIYQLNNEKSLIVDGDIGNLIGSALELCEDTNGALDITIYPVLKMWGFTTGQYQVPDSEQIALALENVNYKGVSLQPAGDGTQVNIDAGMQIDLGSVAKGYTGDQIIQYLEESQVECGLISLGGNVQTYGTKPDGSLWKVAIASPFDVSGYVGYVEVANKAVITSGGYQRYFEQDGIIYHHIIDPGSGYPVDNSLVSVSVIGDSGLMCDGLSTALFVMGFEEAIEYWRADKSFDLVLIDEDGNVFITEGIEDVYTDTSGEGVTVIY